MANADLSAAENTVTVKVTPIPAVLSSLPPNLFGYKPERERPKPMVAWAPISRTRRGTRRLGCGKPPARRSTVVRGGDSGDADLAPGDEPPGHKPPAARIGVVA